MKKSLAILLIAMLSILTALIGVGCSQTDKGSEITGTWTLSSVTSDDGSEVSGQDVADAFGGVVTYDFQDGGKLVTAVGDSEVEGTWTQDGDTVSVDVGGQTGEGTVSGDTLTIESGGGISEFTRA